MSDVIVAASVTQLYDEIDGLSTVQRLRRDVVCQGPAIDSLSAAHRESVVAISQVNEQLMRLETEIADIHSRVDRHAAAATAAARDYAESLRQQIATLVESMEHSIRAITDATERAEANAATAVADVAALASQQDEQRATMERLRGHINAQIAGSADSTQRRLDLQLEELIRQRGILTELGQGTRKPLCRWLLIFRLMAFTRFIAHCLMNVRTK
jgi:chromosome segregation ATPase